MLLVKLPMLLWLKEKVLVLPRIVVVYGDTRICSASMPRSVAQRKTKSVCNGTICTIVNSIRKYVTLNALKILSLDFGMN